jgi:hypothetical protein
MIPLGAKVDAISLNPSVSRQSGGRVSRIYSDGRTRTAIHSQSLAPILPVNSDAEPDSVIELMLRIQNHDDCVLEDNFGASSGAALLRKDPPGLV